MHLGNAIAAHEEWKSTFRDAIAGNATLDVVLVSAEDACDFGQWLYGEGRRLFGDLPIFSQCVETHRLFHLEAGKIAEAINVKDFLDANCMLAANTSFSDVSNSLAVSISRLKQEAVSSPGIISLIAKLSE